MPAHGPKAPHHTPRPHLAHNPRCWAVTRSLWDGLRGKDADLSRFR